MARKTTSPFTKRLEAREKKIWFKIWEGNLTGTVKEGESFFRFVQRMNRSLIAGKLLQK